MWASTALRAPGGRLCLPSSSLTLRHRTKITPIGSSFKAFASAAVSNDAAQPTSGLPVLSCRARNADAVWCHIERRAESQL